MVWIPTEEYIIALFNDHIKNEEIINRQGLISTLDKVKWGISFQELPTIWDRVAILYKEIIEYHYFSDGNKRIGVLISFIFLHKNNYEFSPPSGEILNFTLDVAQGLKEFEDVKDWFKTNSKKIGK